MGEKTNVRNIIITHSPLQITHEISLEYVFSDPKFEIVQYDTSNYMPIFVATCEIQKESNIYISMEKNLKQRKRLSNNSVRKLLEPVNCTASKRKKKIVE